MNFRTGAQLKAAIEGGKSPARSLLLFGLGAAAGLALPSIPRLPLQPLRPSRRLPPHRGLRQRVGALARLHVRAGKPSVSPGLALATCEVFAAKLLEEPKEAWGGLWACDM